MPAALENPAAKKTLGALRRQLRELLPGAVETLSYQMPTFKVDGNAVAGFAFFKTHCGYYPFSGGVVPALKEQLDGYTTSKSGVTFPPDKPLPAKLVKTLVQARLAEIAARGKKLSAVKKKASAKKALITDRVTDSAVKEATGRDWKGGCARWTRRARAS
ncbi:iron chaperone [Cystobacter fuscus]